MHKLRPRLKRHERVFRSRTFVKPFRDVSREESLAELGGSAETIPGIPVVSTEILPVVPVGAGGAGLPEPGCEC